MYAKIFSQILDSSIAEDHNVRHFFMDLLVLADPQGVVDMTAEALARRTNIPLKTVIRCLQKLTEPDQNSRSHEHEGRRIVPIDPERSWGWQIVNFVAYHQMKDLDAKREYMRTYMQKRREEVKVNTNVLTGVNSCKTLLNDVTHEDEDEYKDEDIDLNEDEEKENNDSSDSTKETHRQPQGDSFSSRKYSGKEYSLSSEARAQVNLVTFLDALTRYFPVQSVAGKQQWSKSDTTVFRRMFEQHYSGCSPGTWSTRQAELFRVAERSRAANNPKAWFVAEVKRIWPEKK